MYYRIVNELNEPLDKELDSRIQSQGSPRKKRASELYRLMAYIYSFADRHSLKIMQAMAIAVNPEVYIPVIKNAYNSGLLEIQYTDIGVFMPGSILIPDILEYMQQYQKLTDEAHTWIHSDGPDQSYMTDYIWESRRRTLSAKLPSRFESVFLFDDLEVAQKYNNQLYDNTGTIATVELLSQRALGNYDMQWIFNYPDSSACLTADSYARRYWLGKQSDECIWEYLYDGTYSLHAIQSC